jgi:Fe-S-cluster formation regulator IscX/YfhJ
MKILEQLTEIENFIKKIEHYMDENGIEGDREKILEAIIASRIVEKN